MPYALYSESSGNAVWEQSGGNAFYNNGNVGIGTSIPTNLLELSSAAPKLYFNRENSTTNLSGLYWRSTSDNFEGAFVRNNASGGFELYSDITGGTPRLMITNEGRIGIGTTNPIYRMHIEDFIHSGQVFKCDNNQSQAYLSYDKIGVFGCGVTTPFGDGGTGVRGWGSHYGVKGDASYQGVGERYGVYGSAANGEGGNYGVYGYAGGFQGAQYGVYGKASSGWGVYFSGGLAGSGSKSAVVKTEDGPKAVYCQESPENWFEDFGSATIINGMARIALAGDFLQTVTINNEHPAKVFITPNARLGDWWVEKGDTHFILYSPEAKDGSAFDYRIVAKRKGYEDLRLEIVEDAYTDTCLYPTIDEVPDQFKEAWLEVNQKKESVLLINLK
ncbi:MAG: hypothetical protein JW861_13575 [Bacteroidales bacterium]|nr:hypothetical protein [Bacteroidales bacterium]